MANRNFSNTQTFWDRVNEAIADSGKSKLQLALELDIERKALTPRKCPNGQYTSWHSSRVADFCKATGVSADWLLGLSDNKKPAAGSGTALRFKVVDIDTGEEPLLDDLHIFSEEWFINSGLTPENICGWVVDPDGYPMLLDVLGAVAYPPEGRFKAILI